MRNENSSTGFGEDTLSEIRRLVDDPVTRPIIAKDSAILGGIVLLLDNDDCHVVKMGLEILLKCAALDRDTLCRLTGLTETLQDVMVSGSVAVQELARTILDLLDTPQTLQTPLRDSTNHTEHRSRVGGKKRRNSFFLGSKAKIVTLHIRGLFDKDDVEVCRNSLLTVRGVISITFDYKKKRAVLRTKPDLKPELLGEAVARTMTMQADLVTKDDAGQEVTVPLKPSAAAERGMLSLPEYPSDEESPVKGDNLVARGDEAANQGQAGWGLGGFINKLSDMVATNLYW